MLLIDAIVTLRGPDRGGLKQPASDGFRPSFAFGGELVACEVRSNDGLQALPLEQPLNVLIRCPYADQLGWEIPAGTTFQLNSASQVVGDGVVVQSSIGSGRI